MKVTVDKKKELYLSKNALIKLKHSWKISKINLKKSNTWKTHLTIATNFIPSKDIDEEHVMHSKSNNTEIIVYDKADEVIQELFESRLCIY